MMNMILFDGTEYSAHTADNASLLAVMDIAAADYVTADIMYSDYSKNC